MKEAIEVEATLRLALEALENSGTDMDDAAQYQFEIKAITAIQEALMSMSLRDGLQDGAQPKPLTDEKISLIAHNTDTCDWNDLNFKECWHKGFKAGFREAEIEHNIKG